MPSTLDFLQAVLPSEGWYCGFILPTKKHVWCETIEELSNVLSEQDALGHQVYHGCASYSEPTTRAKSNVLRVRSLWLDVDAGPTKPYSNAVDAWKAVETFRNKAGLPLPLYVNSGTGLHVYWILEEELDRNDWERYAEHLKRLCASLGLHAGPERTADCASILRPPGSHHRKDPTRPLLVQMGQLPDRVSVAAFGRVELKPKKQAKPTSTLTASLMNVVDYGPSNPEQIADHCIQMDTMRMSQGVMPEPDWKACINVLAFAENGRHFAHEWSKGDERYDPAQTDEKFDRGRDLSGPTTCAYFSGMNDKCKGCVFAGQVVSPIELGRGSPRRTKEQAEVAKQFASEEFDFKPVGAFQYRSGSLMFMSEKNDGSVDATLVSQYPVYVQSVNRGEVKTDQFSVALCHKPPHEDWQTVEVPLKSMFGSGGVAEVIGRGIVIHDSELFKKFVRESIDMLNAQSKADVQFEQFGWKDSETSFLVGRRLYTPTSIREVAGSPEITKRSRDLVLARNGSVEGWKEAVDQLFAVGVEPQGFAVLCSFAAPLMRFHSADEGGAVVSITSHASGKGKTTALVAASSVWGQLPGLQMVNIDTKVSKGIMLGVLGNLPVIYDELSNRDPASVVEFLQMVTNGRDKQRGTGEGQLIHSANTWQTIMITGGNKSLVDTVRAAKGSDAMATRVIEFTVDLPKDMKHWQGDRLKDQLSKNAGYAGDLYMKTLVQPETLAFVKKALPSIREEIIQKYNFNSEHRFWARTMASVAVASVIVKHLGLISFSPDRIQEWAIDKLLNYKKFEEDEAQEGSHMLARFLAQHLSDTLIMPRAWSQRERGMMPLKVPNRALLIRHEVANGVILIDEKALREWMVNEGVAWRDLLNELQSKGVLVHSRKLATLGAGTDMATGQVPCVQVDGRHPMLSGALMSIDTTSEAKAG
jgi:Domain of unknown function (DUF927)